MHLNYTIINKHADFNKTFVLTTIYIVFFEIGLPNSIIGTAWPEIRLEMGLPFEYIGILNMGLLVSSMFACIFSGNTVTRFGIKKILPIAIVVFIITMLGVSFVSTFAGIVILLIPIGYSMGTIDSGTNLYMSTHFESRNMNILHCAWGIGALLGPIIMVIVISGGFGWRGCFVVIATLGVVPLIFILWCSLKKIWSIQSETIKKQTFSIMPHQCKQINILYQFLAIMIFFLHTGITTILGSLLSSYMNDLWNAPLRVTGITVTLFLASLTASRIVAGILVKKTGNLRMIRAGLVVAITGCIIASISNSISTYDISIVIIGFGIGPIFPCLMYETPYRFTPNVAKRLVGYQVAAAQLGGSLITMAVAMFLAHTSMKLMMPIEIILFIIIFSLNEIIVKRLKV